MNPPLPPQILKDEPGQANLAQFPKDKEIVMEEIVVVVENRWRLPDLGSRWRLANDPPPKSRLTTRFLPLYDPDPARRLPDIFQVDRQQERFGYLELFLIRFGTRPQQTIVPTVSEPNP